MAQACLCIGFRARTSRGKAYLATPDVVSMAYDANDSANLQAVEPLQADVSLKIGHNSGEAARGEGWTHGPPSVPWSSSSSTMAPQPGQFSHGPAPIPMPPLHPARQVFSKIHKIHALHTTLFNSLKFDWMLIKIAEVMILVLTQWDQGPSGPVYPLPGQPSNFPPPNGPLPRQPVHGPGSMEPVSYMPGQHPGPGHYQSFAPAAHFGALPMPDWSAQPPRPGFNSSILAMPPPDAAPMHPGSPVHAAQIAMFPSLFLLYSRATSTSSMMALTSDINSLTVFLLRQIPAWYGHYRDFSCVILGCQVSSNVPTSANSQDLHVRLQQIPWASHRDCCRHWLRSIWGLKKIMSPSQSGT